MRESASVATLLDIYYKYVPCSYSCEVIVVNERNILIELINEHKTLLQCNHDAPFINYKIIHIKHSEGYH